VLVFASRAGSACPPDHLLPVPSDLESVSPGYHFALRKILLKGIDLDSTIVVILPALTPEAVTWIEPGSSTRVCTRRLERAISEIQVADGFPTSDLPEFPRSEECSSLNHLVAAEVRESWIAALRGTRYENPSCSVPIDGTMFHFLAFVLHEGTFEGYTLWSEKALAPLALALTRFAKDPTEATAQEVNRLARKARNEATAAQQGAAADRQGPRPDPPR
jgi:hypothetical protein